MSSPSSTSTSTNSPRTHPDFQDPEANFVLLSSNGTRFLIRRAYLEVGSFVFEDMFKSLGLQETKQEMKVEETEADLAVFLSFFSKDVKRSQSLKMEEIERLLCLADKYNAPLVAEMAVHFLTPFVETDAPFVFGAAVVYHQLALARSALSKFGSAVVDPPLTHYKAHGGGHYQSVGACANRKSTPSHLLSSVPPRFLSRFPVGLLLRLMKMQEDVAFSNALWSTLAATLEDI